MTVPDAVFRKELPGCLYGTRRGLLEELRQWASDRSEPQVYWLHGHAGSGKSTIAQSFAAALSSQGDLGASFFCSRKLRDGSNTRRILPTLSHQLSVTSTVFRKALLRELKADESFATSVSLAVQLKHLVVIPALYVQCSTVILIDALCECADNQSVLFLLSHLIRPFIPSKPYLPSGDWTHIPGHFAQWIQDDYDTENFLVGESVAPRNEPRRGDSRRGFEGACDDGGKRRKVIQEAAGTLRSV